MPLLKKVNKVFPSVCEGYAEMIPTLLIVVQGQVLGIPARRAACVDGACNKVEYISLLFCNPGRTTGEYEEGVF